jgi:hypothetical protein
MRKVVSFLALYGFVLLGVVPSAHAYIDPGSGSMLLQLLLGGAAGLVVLIKLYWQRFLALFGGGEKEAELPETPLRQSQTQSDPDDNK